MKILHIAPYNTAGVPITFVRAERQLGHDSRLVTLQRDPRGYEEDICLELPGWEPQLLLLFRRHSNRRPGVAAPDPGSLPAKGPPRWSPGGPLAKAMILLRDRLSRPIINRAIAKYGLDQFDVYQLDGGHGFIKYDNYVARWHAAGKKVICCYLGSDLRTRGVMPGIDRISDCTVSLEWDHLDLDPAIRHVYFPFEPDRVPAASHPGLERLRIGHSPSNRKLKGTDRILAAIEKLRHKHPIDLVLIEGLPHQEALKLKATCHLGIDQLSELGYGISALEWLAMGIPVVTSVAPRMAREVPHHPFLAIDDGNVEQQLERIIARPQLWAEMGKRGRAWVAEHHDAAAVVKNIHQLAGIG